VASATARELAGRPFDHAVELPVRCAVLTSGRTAAALVLVLSHLAVDAQGADILAEQLQHRLVLDGCPPATPWQPRNQVEHERSRAARAASEQAIIRWQEIARTVARSPARSVLDGGHSTDRFVELCLESTGCPPALASIAARCEASSSSIMLAAVCLAFAALDGRHSASVTLICGNRYRARERGYVGPMAQDTPFGLSWSAVGFDELCRQAHREALAAFASGRYDPNELDAAMTALARPDNPTGKSMDFFNYVQPATPVAASQPMPDERAASGQPARIGAWPALDLQRFFVYKQLGEVGKLRLIVDTAMVSEAVAALLMLELERCLLRLATGDLAIDELSQALVPGSRTAARRASWSPGIQNGDAGNRVGAAVQRDHGTSEPR